MPGLANLQYDVASAITLGQRDFQEDALICDFPLGSELGFAVLADGMGGHAAGDIASKIVVTEVFSELKLQSGDPKGMEADIADVLMDAALAANDCVGSHANAVPGTEGMGATLVAPVLMRDHLYWISVGDSPLLLFRDGILTQLNEDHSMAPQIDYLVRTGLMEVEAAMNHPDRNCLTSVLAGHQIPRIDCPVTPVKLQDGDIIIAASDGLQFLDDNEIADLLSEHANSSSADISAGLLRCLEELDDPDQDNISFCVIKVRNPEARTRAVQMMPLPDAQITPRMELPVARAKKEKLTIMTSKSGSSILMMSRISSERSA
jgi:protein phosphatase